MEHRTESPVICTMLDSKITSLVLPKVPSLMNMTDWQWHASFVKVTFYCCLSYFHFSQVVSEIRKTMESFGFIEVETPVLQVWFLYILYIITLQD